MSKARARISSAPGDRTFIYLARFFAHQFFITKNEEIDVPCSVKKPMTVFDAN
jgi:hypothetical protein